LTWTICVCYAIQSNIAKDKQQYVAYCITLVTISQQSVTEIGGEHPCEGSLARWRKPGRAKPSPGSLNKDQSKGGLS
jgi:hypothetical protein